MSQAKQESGLNRAGSFCVRTTLTPLVDARPVVLAAQVSQERLVDRMEAVSVIRQTPLDTAGHWMRRFVRRDT